MVQKTIFKGCVLQKINKLVVSSLFLPLFSMAQPVPFAVKGKVLGMDQAQACDGSVIDDFIRSREIAASKGISHMGSACEVPVISLAGITHASPLGLVFWSGKLVRVAARISPMDMDSAANLRVSLMDAYGKPATRRNRPFVTDTWRGKNQLLELEMTWVDGEPVAAGIYLTDISGWATFLKVIDRVEQAKANDEKRLRQIDLLR